MPWTFPLWEEAPVVDPATGELVLPDAPGVGFRFDATALARLAVA